MGYKFKPSKGMKKRFRVSKTGKLKRNHGFTSHLMSARPAKKRRKLRKAAVMYEAHAKRLRRAMGVGHLHPSKVEHEARIEAKAKEAA